MSAQLRQLQNPIVIDERYIRAMVLLKLPNCSGSGEPDNCFGTFDPLVRQ